MVKYFKIPVHSVREENMTSHLIKNELYQERI